MKLFFIILYLFLLTSVGLSFDWEPVTDDDWNFQLPDSVNKRYAAILFEKIYIDDTKLFNHDCMYSLYRRIRIFQNEGRDLGDVQVPLLKLNSDIEELEGRVILKDGTIIELNSDHIFSKYVIETDEDEVEQTFFYLPGVTSDCIIEYYIEYKLFSTYYIWDFEKNLYLKYGELTWKFYKGNYIPIGSYDFLLGAAFPNYVALNNFKALNIENITDGEMIDKVVFSTKDIKPFEKEKYTIGSAALKAQLICFYTIEGQSEEYWVSLSSQLNNEEANDTISKAKIAELKSLAPDTTDKQILIDFAYDWVIRNIKNIDLISSDEKYLITANLDSVINKGYGTSNQINNLFYHILKILGIKAYPVYCLSRKKDIYHPSAKYWQFKHRITAVRRSLNKYEFYDLSNKNIQKGLVDFIYEDTYGFIVGCLPITEIHIPPSDCKDNTILFYDNITIDDDLTIKSSFTRKYKGHFATEINSELNLLEETNNSLNSMFENNPAIKSIDTVYIKDKNSGGIALNGDAKFENYMFSSGNFLVFRPFNSVDVYEDIGYNEKRIHPIQFDYPYNQKNIIQIFLPQNITLYKFPKEKTFSNDIGECAASFSRISDHQISILYSFTLKHASLKQTQYTDLLKLFEARREILSEVILLTEK
jgi:hypothetical protein